MLKPPTQESLPAELKRVSSAQFKAFQQGLPSSIKDSGFWTKTIHIRRLGRVRIWPLVVMLSSLLTFFSISFITDSYNPFTTKLAIERPLNQTVDAPFLEGCQDPVRAAAEHPRENAAFVVLARNKEISGVLSSMSYLESHFNQWFNYPYVFLNNEEFDSNFKRKVRNATDAEVEFGVVGPDAWGFPDWVEDLDELKESIAQQGDRAIMYGGLETYHHMCRFFSGFFFNHPLLLKYDWYWRVEPDVKFFCDITYDPFRFMAEQGKVYGFVIAIKELVETVPNMFRYASAWKRKKNLQSTGMWNMLLKPKEDKTGSDSAATLNLPKEILQHDPIKPDDKSHQISPDSMEGEAYNMCHFWSNFEIARLDFFRSPEYMDFFEEMDLTGGFWRERWGDAPIHSLGAGLLLEPEQVHYFRDIGYQHTDIFHCPANAPGKQLKRPANADGSRNDRGWDRPKTNGPGCRCECPTDLPEVESKEGTCINEWADVIGGWLDKN